MENLKFSFKHIHVDYPTSVDVDYFVENAFKRGQISKYMHSKFRFPGEQNTDRFIGKDIWHPSVITICVVKDLSGNEIGIGYSFCSWKDNFNKKVGRNIAKNRALESLNKENKND